MSPDANVELPMEIEDKNQQAMVGFWWTSTLIKQAAKRFFKQHGSSEAHFNLLATLLRSDHPMTQNELSRKLLVDKSHVTGLLDRLSTLGFIERKPVDGDRRSYHVALTAEGRVKVERLQELYADEVARIMGPFSQAERAELMRLTRKLRVSMAHLGL